MLVMLSLGRRGARAADAHDASFGARNGHAQGELMLVLLALDSA